MKTFSLSIVLSSLLCIIIFTSAHGEDCPGPWQKLPNFKKGSGGACKALGLDSKRGTCQPGQIYETLCDDIEGGRYKTCQGSRRCDNQAAPQSGNCRQWDFVYNQPCPQGYVNVDCQGACEQQSGRDNCERWDFIYNKPCPNGYVNYDCQGGCEPASFFGK